MYEVEVAVDEQGITGDVAAAMSSRAVTKHMCGVRVEGAVPGTFKGVQPRL